MKELKGYNYSPEKQQPQQFWPVALSSRFSMLILRIFNILFKAHSIFSYIFIIYKNKIRSISYSPNSILYQKTSLLSKLLPSVAFYIETRHLICCVNQITGVYMKCSTRLKRVNHVAPGVHKMVKLK